MESHTRSLRKQRTQLDDSYREYNSVNNNEESITLTVNDESGHEDVSEERKELSMSECNAVTRDESHWELNSWLFSRYLSSWSTCVTDLSVGSIVFAPYRSSSSSSLSLLPTHSCVQSLTNDENVTVHYALAEITGVQSNSGSVCVSFLFTLAGVDDETVSVFDLIPCPLSTLTRMQPATQSHWCSLLERVLHVETSASSLSSSLACRLLRKRERERHNNNNDGYNNLVNNDDQKNNHCFLYLNDVVCLGECQTGTESTLTHNNDNNCYNNNNRNESIHNVTLTNWCLKKEESVFCDDTFHLRKKVKVEQTDCAEQLDNASSSHSLESKSNKRKSMQVIQNNCEDAASFDCSNVCSQSNVLTFEYKAEYNVHTFLAFAFQRTIKWLDGKSFSSYSSRVNNQSWTMEKEKHNNVLCIFDSYEALRHFEVYMCVRGHRIVLLDGTQNAKLLEESEGKWLELLLPAQEREYEEQNQSKNVKRNGHFFSQFTQTRGKVEHHEINDSIPTINTVPFHSTTKMSSKALRWLCALREDAEIVLGTDDTNSDMRKYKSQCVNYRSNQHLGIWHLLEHINTLHYTVFFHEEGEEKGTLIEKETHLTKHTKRAKRASSPLALQERPCNSAQCLHPCNTTHTTDILQDELRGMYPEFYKNSSDEISEVSVLTSQQSLHKRPDVDLTSNYDTDRFFHVRLRNLPWLISTFESTKQRYQKENEVLQWEKPYFKKTFRSRRKVSTTSLSSNAVTTEDLEREGNTLKHRTTASEFSESKVQSSETSSRVKVSAEVFQNNKILVPASREQLLLLHTILREMNALQTCNENVTSKELNTVRTTTLQSQNVVGKVNSLLLECVALGNFTNTALHTLFHDYENVICAVAAPTVCKESKEEKWQEKMPTETYAYSSKEQQKEERERELKTMRDVINSTTSDCKNTNKTIEVNKIKRSEYTWSPCDKWQKLERVSCESACYFSSFKELHHILFSEPALIDSIFPVFAAVKAIVNDTFETPSHFTTPWQRTRSVGDARKSKRKATRPLLPKVIILMPYSDYKDERNECMSNNLHENMSCSNNWNGSCRCNTSEQGSMDSLNSCSTCDRSAMPVETNTDEGANEIEKYNLLVALRLFFSPWYLYNITWKACEQKESNKCSAPLDKWRTSGGVAIVSINNSVTQLGQIHLEADVIIAAGKRAAAWAAAHNTLKMSKGYDCKNDSCKEYSSMHSHCQTYSKRQSDNEIARESKNDDIHDTNVQPEKMPTYFAVMSEIEVVHDIVGHHWTWYDTCAFETLKMAEITSWGCEDDGDTALWHTLLKQAKRNNTNTKTEQFTKNNKIVDEALRYYLHMEQKKKEQLTTKSTKE